MSKDTEEALRKAIVAHAKDQPWWHDGDFLGEWAIAAYWVLPHSDTANGYSRLIPEGQPYHHTLGLLTNCLTDYVNDVGQGIDED